MDLKEEEESKEGKQKAGHRIIMSKPPAASGTTHSQLSPQMVINKAKANTDPCPNEECLSEPRHPNSFCSEHLDARSWMKRVRRFVMRIYYKYWRVITISHLE